MSSKMSRSVARAAMCTRCELQQSSKRQRLIVPVMPFSSIRYSSTSTPTSIWPRRDGASSPQKYFTKLKNRRIIRISGPDATQFLHDLVPAPIQPVDGNPIWLVTAFLNAKGRIIHQILIRKPDQEHPDTFYLDVDANSVGQVKSHIKKHKLRSKFTVEELDSSICPYYTWPASDAAVKPANQDPRPGMGQRDFQTDDASHFSSKDGKELEWQDYMIHRMLNGHAEGPVEVVSQHALPQESNLDFYGGIDFHKGCYLGQELTIRTHHTGVVRKRILPVQIYTDDSPISADQTVPMYDDSLHLPQPLHEATISKVGAVGRNKNAGKWLGGYGNIGLALCRMELMTDVSLTAEGSQYDAASDQFVIEAGEKQLKVKAFVPPWLRQAIDHSIKARSDRSAKKRKDLEDDDDLD